MIVLEFLRLEKESPGSMAQMAIEKKLKSEHEYLTVM
jgi:hypothetical protein